MKTLIFGSNGQLGTDLVKVLHDADKSLFAATREHADVTDSTAVERLLDREAPDAIINCTALHDLSACERNPDEAMTMNALAVAALAKSCESRRLKFLTVSSDYVFDGEKREGYSEEDPVNPRSWYAKSKVAGEWAALAGCRKSFVVRVQSLYGLTGPRGKKLNFVDLMLKLSSERDELKVDQCRMAPTWTYPLAENLIALLSTEHYGLYHMSAHGAITWYEFAKTIMELTNRDVRVIPVSNDFYPRDFDRPENTYLKNTRLEMMDIDLMPSWRESLKGYLAAKGDGITRV